MPDDDSSEFAVNMRTPPGYSLAHTDEIVAQIEDRLRTIPEVRDLFTTVGDTNGDDRVTVAQVDAKLFPLDQRHRSQEVVMADARKLMDAFPALRVSVDAIKPWEQGGYREVAVEYDMRGPDLETLRVYADNLMKRLRTNSRHRRSRLELRRRAAGAPGQHRSRQVGGPGRVGRRYRADDAHDGAGRRRSRAFARARIPTTCACSWPTRIATIRSWSRA